MKNYFNWSGGKDSSLALFKALESGVKIDLLLTTLSAKYKRISMHGVKESLLEAQAQSIGIPLKKVYLPENTTMEDYDIIFGKVLTELKQDGFTTAYFGDIYLEDLRKYREKNIHDAGLKAEFPIWKIQTDVLANEFIEKGFKTKIVAVNGDKLDDSFVGVDYDKQFLNRLPKEIDTCGENGEFHSFCYDGPIYSSPKEINVAEKITRTYDLDKEKGLKSTYYFAELNHA